jgi:predicted NBD/HSP70 family sugar kinase
VIYRNAPDAGHIVGVDIGRRVLHVAVTQAGLGDEDIVVTALGTPGIPDAASGTVHRAPNLPGWERRGLLHALGRPWQHTAPR